MANEFSGLRARTSEASRARAREKANAMLEEMALDELRRARGLSQKALAELLDIRQPSVAKLERRTDVYISAWRAHIEAMGGELDVVPRFPEGAVQITTFSGLDRHRVRED